MPRIIITAEAEAAIRAKAELPFDNSECIRLPEGTCSIPVSKETLGCLRELQLEGMTLSDVIIRLLQGRAQ